MKATTFLLTMSVLATCPAKALTLTSHDVSPQGMMALAQVYGECGGGNRAPRLDWDSPPPRTESFALTVFDPDAKPAGWWHWLVVDIPASARTLGPVQIPAGTRQLVNDFGDARFDGPCPPPGSGKHRYEFALWALPVARAPLDDSAKGPAVRAWLEKSAIANATLTGFYGR